MSIQDFLRRHARNLAAIAREHPLETFWLAVFSLLLLWLPLEALSEQYEINWPLFLPSLVLMYKTRAHRAAYYAAGLLPALLFVSGPLFQTAYADDTWLCLNGLALLALLSPFSLSSNHAFLSRALLTLINLLSALLVTGCLLLAIALLQSGINLLFGYDSFSALGPKPYYVLLFALTPLMFFSFERPWQNNGEPLLVHNRVIELSLNYIAGPFLLLYTLMIYAYTAQIVWRGELPQGGVAYLVGSYLAAGLFTQMLQTLSCEPKWQRFYRLFPPLSLLPLVLLWTGTIERIATYGLTETRIWLLALVILLSLFCLLSLRPQWRQYRTFSALLLAAGLLVGILLPVERIAGSSQQARFERMLDSLQLKTADGRIVQPLPQPAAENQAAWQELYWQAYALERYYGIDETVYGPGFEQLLVQEMPQPAPDSPQSQYVGIRNIPFTLERAGSLSEVSSVHFSGTNAQGNPVLNIAMTDASLVNAEMPHNHLDTVFARHGLNPKQHYDQETLQKTAADLLRIPLDQDRLLLVKEIALEYDPQHGYAIGPIHAPFALFTPQLPSR